MGKGNWIILALCLLLAPRQQGLAQQAAPGALPASGVFSSESSDDLSDEDIDHAADEDIGPTQPEPPASAIESFFNDLNAGTVSQKVEAMMTPTVIYEDPFGRYEGRDKALEHLKQLLGSMLTLNVDVKEEFVSGEETVALWTMTLTNRHLASGEQIVFDGVTRVRVQNNKIVAQSSQFDLGAAYYEHLPVIGWVVRWAKGKAAN
ncbi:MAG: nuclear transport factor 2 family protein [Proteobacteria bacterium]|nr:nuclear transport factor 2 family protein [Pseudomonadota bacterium]